MASRTSLSARLILPNRLIMITSINKNTMRGRINKNTMRGRKLSINPRKLPRPPVPLKVTFKPPAPMSTPLLTSRVSRSVSEPMRLVSRMEPVG